MKLTKTQREQLAAIVDMQRRSEGLADAAKEAANNLSRQVCPYKIGEEITVEKGMPGFNYGWDQGKRLRCINVSGEVDRNYGRVTYTVEWVAAFGIVTPSGKLHAGRRNVRASAPIG